MIGRNHRFHGHNSLQHLYTRRTVVRAGQISLKYSLNKRREAYRLAVVVSRKVSKHAVVRNRIRRRIYETIRLLITDPTVPYDMAIFVYDDKVAEMPQPELTKTIAQLLEKATIISASAPHAIVDTKE
jgi:ribonuclease P protein component